jgi:putative membrane protein
MSGYNEKLSSIKTQLMVGWIFALIAVLAWVGLFLFYFVWVFLVLGVLSTGFTGVNSYLMPYYAAVFLSGLAIGIFSLIWLIPTILVMRRMRRMYKAAGNNDISKLKQTNSLGWAIIGLIFAGVIPGIMMLVAHGPINELGSEPPPPPPQT